MKRFSVFLIIIIVTVSIGFLSYYFLKDNETLTIDQAFFEKNSGEDWSIECEFYKHKENTTLTITSSDANIVTVGAFTITEGEDHKSILSIPCTPVSGGYATITIETTNENISKIIVDISVGDGSTEFPYFVDSASQLGLIGSTEKYSLESSYRLSNDINLADYREGEWAPIGGETGFSGKLDGNYHTIYNLKVTTDTANAGLFTILAPTAIVQNLTVSGVNISGVFTNAGAIAGINYGRIKLVSVISNITSIGGAVTNTTAGASVTATGAIAGKNVRASIDATVATMNQSFSNITVTGCYNVGGLVGYNGGSYIYNCYSTGAVNKTTEVGAIGGLIGYNDLFENKSSYVKDCYSISVVSATLGQRGSVIGFDNSVETGDKTNVIFGCYYNIDLNVGLVGIGNKADVAISEDYVVVGKTTIDLKTETTYMSHRSNKNTNTLIPWDFSTAWVITTGELPVINFSGAEGASGFDSININGSNVNTKEGLTSLKDNLNDNFLLNADIDMGGTAWNPIVLYNGILQGVSDDYDGTGVVRFPKIKNFKIETANNGVYAFFEELGSNAQVMNIIFETVTISGTGERFAVVAGINKGTISNIQIGAVGAFATINANTHTLSVDTFVGGVAAYNEGIIKNCTVNATITSNTRIENNNYVGGVTGLSTSSATITECTMQFGEIDMQNDYIGYVGGIAGSNAGAIEYSYSNGCEIKSSSIYSGGGNYRTGHFSGGLVGYLRDTGKIQYAYSKANVSGYFSGGIAGLCYGKITECYANANIYGHRAGGLVALQRAGSAIKNCYAQCNLYGYKNASGYDDGHYSFSSIKAGLAAISEGSDSQRPVLSQCYVACSFLEQGLNFFDTSTIVPDRNQAGDVRGNVIDVTLASNALYAGHQGFWGALAKSPLMSWMYNYEQYFVTGTTETLKGNSSDGFKIFTSYNFGDSTWSFAADSYPELKVFQTYPFFTGVSSEVEEVA